MRLKTSPSLDESCRKRFGSVLVLALCTTIGFATQASAQPPDSPVTDKDNNSATVAATVDGKPIYAAEVQRELTKALKQRQIDPTALNLLQAQTLHQLINRRLILGYFDRKKLAASQQDIDLALTRLKKRLDQQSISLEDYLSRAGIDRKTLRHSLTWNLGWQKYLDHYLTDENLQRFFLKHHREFDGTQLRVAHILWKVNSTDSSEALQIAIKNAKQIREEILNDKTTFAKAAQSFSTSPTAAKGGDIGFISRHQPMGEAFSAAAFKLQLHEISPPVVTSFGVHLIRCLEIKPGKKTWQDVRSELRPAVTRYLFQWTADQQRAHATVKIF